MIIVRHVCDFQRLDGLGSEVHLVRCSKAIAFITSKCFNYIRNKGRLCSLKPNGSV